MDAETVRYAVGSRHGGRQSAAGLPAEKREANMNVK